MVWLYKKIVETFCASLAAEILVAPLVVYYFHNFPTLFLVANVLAWVFMFVVLILGILIIATGWVPVVASALAVLTTWIVVCFNMLLEWLQLFNPTSFHFLKLNGLELLLLYVAIAGFGVLLLRQRKAGLFVGLVGCCLLMVLLCMDKYSSLQQEKLVVYNTGKANHIELIVGDHYSVLHTDTLAGKKIRYATQPAHIQWQAWRQQPSSRDSVLYVNSKRILILNTPAATGNFPVDVVVVNYHGDVDLKQLKNVFDPGYIVIGNNYSRKEQAALKKAARSAEVYVHSVGLDGAFVVN